MTRKQINEEYILQAFFAVHLILMLLLPRITDLSISLWTQVLAYGGGFLLGIQVLGDKRIIIADGFLSKNGSNIQKTVNRFTSYYLLVREQEKGDRRELGEWYLFSILSLLLIAVLIKFTLPKLFGSNVRLLLMMWSSKNGHSS